MSQSDSVGHGEGPPKRVPASLHRALADAAVRDSATRPVKDEINLALDQLESAGHALAETAGYSRLTERLGEILADLEQWKADVWEALDA